VQWNWRQHSSLTCLACFTVAELVHTYTLARWAHVRISLILLKARTPLGYGGKFMGAEGEPGQRPSGAHTRQRQITAFQLTMS